jgi:membrane-associated phospholipid phosphatase
MATYLFALMAWVFPSALSPINAEGHRTFIFLIFIVTFLLPAFNIGLFKALGTIQSFAMVERRERILPFIFITTIYCVITYLLYAKTKMDLGDNFLRLMIVIDMLVVVSTLLTFFFKVSVHSIGIWGLVGMLILLTKVTALNSLLYISLGLIVLAGIIMSARLQLGVHTSREVMWGSIVGLVTGVTGMLVLF